MSAPPPHRPRRGVPKRVPDGRIHLRLRVILQNLLPLHRVLQVFSPTPEHAPEELFAELIEGVRVAQAQVHDVDQGGLGRRVVHLQAQLCVYATPNPQPEVGPQGRQARERQAGAGARQVERPVEGLKRANEVREHEGGTALKLIRAHEQGVEARGDRGRRAEPKRLAAPKGVHVLVRAAQADPKLVEPHPHFARPHRLALQRKGLRL